MKGISRCSWVPENDIEYTRYHDEEWGVPIQNNDNLLFENLSLEVAQVGLSWRTVLLKRDAYRELFKNFDVEKVAAFSENYIERISQDPKIIRYKRKNEAIVNNAKQIIKIQQEIGSFSKYLWDWVDNTPMVRSPKDNSDYITTNGLSDDIAKDLKHRGFKFIGSTNIFAFLQSIGIIQDHTIYCFRYSQL